MDTNKIAGPWKLDVTDGLHSKAVCVYDEQQEVMICECYDGDDADRIAYARLIAAAPDLLEALRAIVQQRGFACDCGVSDDVFEQIDAAIAKATG